MSDILDRLRGGLIVSCQPVDDGPMDRPDIVAAMAAAAVSGGAAGVRIEGVENLRAVRAAVGVPIIGIVKRDIDGSPVRITPYREDVAALAEAGADIIAVDGTDRDRPVPIADLLASARRAGCLAMADCATVADGAACAGLGFDILGTTLSGYTAETSGSGPEPDFALIEAFRGLGAFTMAEGRFGTPELAGRARGRCGCRHGRHGADAARGDDGLLRGGAASAAGPRLTMELRALDGFAVDLGGTKIAAARIAAGTIAARAQVATDGTADGEAQVAAMRDLLGGLGYRRGVRLGIAVAGRIDARGGWHAVNGGTLAKVSGIPLQDLAAGMIGECRCINDGAAAVVAEARHGAGRGVANLAYVTVSTGIGGGLIVGDRLLTYAMENSVVEVPDRRIVAVRNATASDARDRHMREFEIVAPGFIDLQINGAGDRQFNFDPMPQTLRIMAEAAARGGTALILPTFITAEGTAYRRAIEAVCQARATMTPGILGLHLEGPFLSPERPGIHPVHAIRDMRDDDLARLQDAALAMPLLVTLAPERVSDARLHGLSAAGARVFAGHSNADADRIDRAVAQGLRGATHLFNAMSQMTSRAPGVVGATMASDTLFAGIIADGHHVDWRSLKAAVRAMRGRLFLVTDAMLTLAGNVRAFALEGRAIHLSQGRLAAADGTLAGAHIDMVTCVRNAVEHGGCTLPEALDMASGIPARAMGVADSVGRIEVGQRACLTMLSGRLEVVGVLSA